MNLKKLLMPVLFSILMTASTASADMYTQTLTIGEDNKDFTQYKENKDHSFYTEETTNNTQPINTIVIPTVQYVPVTSYPYTFSSYSYYPATTNIIYHKRPYTCVRQPCYMPNPPHHPNPPNHPTPPVIPPTMGGVQINTNFAGGYSYGGDPRTWSSARPGRIYGRYGAANSGVNIQIK